MKKPVKAKPVPCTHKINSKGQDVSDHVHTDMLRRGRDANGVPPVVGLGDGTITGDGKFVAEAPSSFPDSGNANEFKGVTRPNLIRLILDVRKHAQDQVITHADQLALAIAQRDAAAANLVASQDRTRRLHAHLDYKCTELASLAADRQVLREELAAARTKPTLRARIKGWISRHRNYGWLVLLLVVCLAQIGAAQPLPKFGSPQICGADDDQCKADGGLNESRTSPQLATHPTVGIPEGEAINAEPIGSFDEPQGPQGVAGPYDSPGPQGPAEPGRRLLVAWDVPAVQYETPASHPCNVSAGGNGFATAAVCVTAPETHWKCNDSARILLTSEDGVRHCILFPPQQPEIISITEGTSATATCSGSPSSYGDYSNGVCVSNGENWIPLTSGGAKVKPTPKAKVPQPKAKSVPAVRKAQP